MTLDYRLKRDGRLWLAFLRRPASDRPLFYVGSTKHEALAALLTGVGKMAAQAPGRLWPQQAAAQVHPQVTAAGQVTN